MFKLITFFTVSLFLSVQVLAQEEAIENKSFLIIHSTKNYNKALKKAQLACNKLGYTLDLRSLYRNKDGYLTTSEICGCGEQHGYIPRGRYDDGNYVSIEYSSDYTTFRTGFYIVIVSSGNREGVTKELAKTREYFKDAYIKDAPIYMGCMH